MLHNRALVRTSSSAKTNSVICLYGKGVGTVARGHGLRFFNCVHLNTTDPDGARPNVNVCRSDPETTNGG